MTASGIDERRLVDFINDGLDGVESALVTLLSDPHRRRRYRPRDVGAAYEALWDLSRGSDCFYDVPSIGDLYASWYHLRRVRHATWALRDVVLAEQRGPLAIVDLGTGTGAVPWAVRVLEQYRLEVLRAPTRSVEVVAVDASPFMLGTSRDLWDVRDRTDGEPTIEFRLQAWSDRSAAYPSEAWFVASYLLDHSDATRMEEVAGDVDAIVANAGGRGLVLVGTDARAKRASQDAIVHHLVAGEEMPSRNRWSDRRPSPLALRNGPAAAATAARAALLAGHGVGRGTEQVSWDHAADRYAVVLERTETGPSRPRLIPISGAELALDAPQDRAAAPGQGPVLIRGVAGSGKSEVLVARLVRTIEHEHTRGGSGRKERETRILVTAFNKAIVAHLRARFIAVWSSDPLRSSPSAIGRHCVRSGPVCRHHVGKWGDMDCELELASKDGKRVVRVRFMNWDKVVFRVHAPSLGVPTDRLTVKHEAKLIALAPSGTGTRTESPLDLAFLEAELHAVVFGLECLSEQDYVKVRRVGRRAARLAREDRPAVWVRLMQGGLRTFMHVRHDVLRRLNEAGGLPVEELFDHVLVDEGQDLTRGDLRLVGSLLADGRRLVMTFDPAQALHLGAAASEPRTVIGASGTRRHFRRLDLIHTHRLSHRISTAVRPLAEEVLRAQTVIKGSVTGAAGTGTADGADGSVLLPVPRKSAVPGARPIIIDGADLDIASRAIGDVLHMYRGYFDLRRHWSPRNVRGAPPAGRILMVERDDDLYDLLPPIFRERGLRWQTMVPASNSIDSPGGRSLAGGQWKGLEFPAVVWSTAAMPVFADESKQEVVYTALTRATSILVIVIRQGTSPEVAGALANLRPRDLYFWDDAAEAAWQRVMGEDSA